jgi:hypothetical protein
VSFLVTAVIWDGTAGEHHKISIRGLPGSPSTKRQYSRVTFAGIGSALIDSRSTADRYSLAFTWMQRTSDGPIRSDVEEPDTAAGLGADIASRFENPDHAPFRSSALGLAVHDVTSGST